MALSPTELKVLTFVQTLLEDESEVTPSLIQEKISIALTIKKEWAEGLDKDSIVGELIRRASTWVGDDALLSNDEGHEPWLTHERKKDWRYWQRYREYQEKNFPGKL